MVYVQSCLIKSHSLIKKIVNNAGKNRQLHKLCLCYKVILLDVVHQIHHHEKTVYIFHLKGSSQPPARSMPFTMQKKEKNHPIE